MDTIGSLNTQYVKSTKIIEKLKLFSDRVTGEQSNTSLSDVKKASKSMEYLEELQRDVDCSEYAFLADTVSVGKCYFNCLSAINTYKTKILDQTGICAGALENEIDEVNNTQAAFKTVQKTFFEKNNILVDSIDALNHVIGQCIGSAITIEEKTIEKLKQEAIDLLGREDSVNIRMSDPIQNITELPESFLVARYPIQQVSQEILKDIGVQGTYQNVSLNLRKQGNILVSTDFEHMSDESIDAFVIAYILRFIESFPLGTVNVHIFDRNANYLYKRLTNSFVTESAGEGVKKTVQIHNSYGDLSTFKNVICEDIFKKSTVERPDLYSIYENDTSDPFNLIVIRNGFVDGSGYVSSDVLDTINGLTKPGDTGHKCGIRFFIVDNSRSFDKNITDANKHLINSIKGNCELKLEYTDGKYFVGEKSVEVLKTQENLDVYVQERSKALAEVIGKREKNIISLDDVCAEKTDENLKNIMYIPVGMSGGVKVELPLSCKDEDGTVAGQCIGYMAIGQSGSGKSSFFHSVVLNGCLKYSPRDLQFWLLDFKNGGASSKYSRCGIPHIRIIAENNKIDDALCLFQMVLEEMERRSKAFNDHFTDNIIEYNRKADDEGLEHFPRIIIAIDEVQEIFREDNASVIQKLISSISSRMRSAGMHFIMVAQNLSEGKTYMLKDAFLPSATGRICFRVAPDIPRESGFDEAFIDRKQEIAELKTGEAYVSYGKETIKKVKMAFISPQDMSVKYFADICGRYPQYTNMRPLVIGTKKRLAITDSRQGVNKTYYETVEEINGRNGLYKAVIGEDVYRMSPLSISFSQHENSSVLFLGSDKAIASSLCASTAISLMRQGVKVHLFNGDRTRIQEGVESLQHPFMYLCQYAAEWGKNVENHRLDQLKDTMRDLYAEYLNRQALIQKADFEDPIFDPIFVIVNDLYGIESFTRNDMIESNSDSVGDEQTEDKGFVFDNLNFDYSINENETGSSKETGRFRESIQKIMSDLLKTGYRYNMYVVLAIKGDPSTWRNAHIASEINNVVVFNDTEYADQIENSYYLKEMLKNISSDGNEETMAVWSCKKSFSKIRPIIYKMSSAQEKEDMDKLIKEKGRS